ncbi:MAG: trypsin-like peptidase domain-containing protein [Planctomycetales bacterium]|nr:trypsin-like peptidase domain-containing protein [Planctomycetales bacterium]
MRQIVVATAVALAFAAGAANAAADRVVLKGEGRAVEGEVVKEADAYVVVDLGFTALRVPREAIEKIEKAAPADGAAAGSAPATSGEPDGGPLYSEGRGKDAPVKQHVERYGEAVVKIGTVSGTGSGFVVHPEGYVVTNYHVIERELDLTVTFYVNRGHDLEKVNKTNVRIVALNPVYDLALLKIEELGDLKLKTVLLGDEEALKSGDRVFAIGQPLGLERTVSDGIVSTATREQDGLLFIQTTAQINPGNSGGPLFNSRGEVVGVTNMKVMFGEGLGFAIPARYVKDFLRHRSAFAFDKDNPNTGYRYHQPPRRSPNPGQK